MGKILKRGRVVILLAGRRAGKKAIIVKQIDEGKKKRKFGHALVVGIERPARKVTRSMTQKKLKRRATIKPFVKYVNNNHMLATRFLVKEDKDFDFDAKVKETMRQLEETRKSLKAEVDQKSKLTNQALAAIWSDTMIAWMHVKAMRIFVETVLRCAYVGGNPLYFASYLISPQPKTAPKMRKALEAEATKGESDAQKSYEAFVKDSNALISDLNSQINAKTKAVAAAEGDTEEAKGSHAAAVAELESLAEYKGDLHMDCDFVLKNFAIRQKARMQEMEAIQSAKGILSGAK